MTTLSKQKTGTYNTGYVLSEVPSTGFEYMVMVESFAYSMNLKVFCEAMVNLSSRGCPFMWYFLNL
jgi:hypothetical protein